MADEVAGVTSYIQLGSNVRSGEARAEFTGIVIDAGTLEQLGERDSVQHGERDHEKGPCMESSTGNIQQRQYVRNFEYECQNRENAITITNDNTDASEIKREEQGIKVTLPQIVAARNYIESVVGSEQDSDLEVFDFMLLYQEEICEVVPEIYHMLQSDNAFDDVELQDPHIVIRDNDIIFRVHGGELIDGNHMWILQVPDDSSPHYYLRHQLCTERHETAVMGCIPRSSMRNSTILRETFKYNSSAKMLISSAKMLIIWPMIQTLREAFRNMTSHMESTYL
jgi:hypothetical protein